MIPRRTVVLAGLAGVAGIAVWQADIPPHPVADDRDTTLLAEVVEAHSSLLSVLKSSGADAVVLTAVAQQLSALGLGSDEVDRIEAGPHSGDSIGTLLDTAAEHRSDDATRAHAKALILTLASISAGLRQLAEHSRRTS